MLAIERRNQILEKLQAEKRVVVSELSQIYEVSEETIRRDLEKLEQEGLAIKSYGGAVLNENSSVDLPLNIRKNRNVAGKRKIADIIAGLIDDGDRLMLDASSTALFIAKSIKDKKNITLITNSIEILIELFDVPDWHVMSTGGTAREGTFALVGPQTDKMLADYHVDKAIISCKGLERDSGLMDSDIQHAENKKTMLHSGAVRILALDHSKFDAVAFTKVAECKDIDVVVTDVKPDTEWLQYFEDLHVQCLYPE